MPNLPYNANTSADSVRDYLEGVLPNSRLSEVTVDSAYQPLLLLQTKHVIAAFAFSNSDMNKSYDTLYGGFKSYYTEQKGQWDVFDLAFVFCVQPGLPNLDDFCSKVETDVYFCRKFVIPLTPKLGAAMARLPFLPLTPLNGKSLRPSSAQTFLQQCGVPALLAKYLVVQHERGPERIVEDCTSGKFGEPRDLMLVPNSMVAQPDPTTESVRLKTVTIKNFRAYRKPQTFTVGADVTVLYGPNGFGKTSFFDAVDFAVTGGIHRISSSNEAHFAKTARHLDSKTEESEVSISFLRDGIERHVTRKVFDRKHALLDGRPTERKAILAELTGCGIPVTDRVENFVSLFCATHLFNQEQQELTKDFHDDCRLSPQIVSRMLAFEDYANAVNKATKVRDVLQATIANANKEIQELSGQITDEKKELDRLGQTAKTHANVEALDSVVEELRNKVAAVGITVSSQKPDVVIVRGWRASLEAHHSESLSRSVRLSDLVKEVAGLRRMHPELSTLQQQLAQKELALGNAEKKRLDAEPELDLAEKSLSEMNSKCLEIQAQAILLEWVRNTKPVYVQLINKQRVLTEELKVASDALSHHRSTEDKAGSDLRTLEKGALEATEKLKTKRAELVAVQMLFESVTSWQANLARIDAITKTERTAMRDLEALQAVERELSPQVAAVAEKEARISRQIAEVDKNYSELKALLSQLQGHVHTGTCPLCGEDHGSRDELVRRIQKHVAADAASGSRADLTNVREQAKQLTEQVAINKHKQQTAGANLVALKKERVKLTAEIENFANSAAKLGVVIETTGLTPAEQLQAQHDRIQQEIGVLNRQIQDTGVALETARKVLADAKIVVTTRAGQVKDRQTELARLQTEINHLRRDPRLTQISLDIDIAQLAEIEQLNLRHLTAVKTEAATAETEVTKKRQGMIAVRQDLASIKTQLQAIRTQITNLQKTITQISARLEESDLSTDASEEMLLALIADESKKQAQLLALRDSTSNLELAIDAATTAAALTRLLQNIRSKEKAITTSIQSRDQHQPWLKYFNDLSRLVASQQNEAIATFTHEYGPRTSVIQRRLRSVYGFDEIEIKSHESAINVRVKRHGEVLRPIDYFSQSQQQTLLLGLFLTACSSQTWSAFSPVFLDDPVTHFDDLNTYAFLDLIMGLLESDFGKRQFVIATCDEKLFQLSRQKFRHLSARAKFYRFSAIGADGPTIDEIASS